MGEIKPQDVRELFMGYEFVGKINTNWVARIKELWIFNLINAWGIVEDSKTN